MADWNLPIHTQSGQNRPDNFENIFLTKAFFRKYLKEKCSAEVKLQLSSKYFVNFRFILKSFLKVWK